ncbi:MAG: biotin--[acetyl-CoA-carboxylase] ligase [Saccharofermentans sp.]|nr:biotin--[acetyl-CoA-carboxylase] ligase [Saccharofermentans sp.]
MNTKDSVLKILINSEEYISGEGMSKALGISRAAINTAVKVLKTQGYEIDSVTNKGYKLLNSPDILSTGEICAYLSDTRAQDVIVLDSVDSTNDYLKDLASKGASKGTVVIADQQTKGKGRRGRAFASPSGCGIYLSYLMRPDTGLENISEITSWTAVAITDAIKKAYGIDTNIKWVNDILLDKLKICGILTELSIEGETGRIDSIVIGIGINVNEDSFPKELQGIATSLAIQTKTKYRRAILAAKLIEELDRLAAGWPSAKEYYLGSYKAKNITTGRKLKVFRIMDGEDEGRDAEAIDINPDFSLKVRFTDGTTEDLTGGEVRVRGISGYA